MSDQIWFQQLNASPDELDGFWMCPTPNCDGTGFTFDIFPVDPDHPANDSWSSDTDEDFFDDDDYPVDPDADWDPLETKYAQLEEDSPEHAADLEGEEWKHGLQPGDLPPAPPDE